MSPAPPTIEDFEKQKSEAEKRTVELHRKRDAAAVDDLDTFKRINKELSDEQLTIEHANRGVAELQRREEEAAAEKVEQEREEAYEGARRLQHWREKAAVEVDRAAAELMTAIHEWGSVCNAQADQLKEAGESPEVVRQAHPRSFLVESAIAGAARAAAGHSQHLLKPFKRTVHKGLPLAEGDIKPVAPIEPSDHKSPVKSDDSQEETNQ